MILGETRIIGRYALYGPIASGGMATVHLGRLLGPVGFSRTVAIKRLHAHYAGDPEFVAMFVEEARLAARIRNPHVVPTLDVVSSGGEVFLVMEYVHGESLARLTRGARNPQTTLPERVRVPPAIASTIIAGVLQGLHAAHEASDERGEPLGIVHRDVSPQNVLVGKDGQARLLDFGVAKAAGRAQTTQQGTIKGKIAYMAPEQLRGEGVTRQADVFAAAIVLWELLTGERLFKGDSEGAVVLKVIAGAVRAPSTVVKEGAREIAPYDDVVLRGLAPLATDRFATAREMLSALERCGPSASSATVGEWVEAMAHDVLEKRAQMIAEMETTDPARPPSSGLMPAARAVISAIPWQSTRPSDASTDILRRDEWEPLAREHGEHGSGASLISSALPSAAGRSPSRGLAMPLVILFGLLVAALGSVAFWSMRRAAPHDATTAAAVARAPSPEAAQPSVASPPSPPPAPDDVAAPPTAAPTPAASAAPKLLSIAKTPAPSVRAPPPAASAAAPRKPDCNPPYTYDARGMKHYKPECL